MDTWSRIFRLPNICKYFTFIQNENVNIFADELEAPTEKVL